MNCVSGPAAISTSKNVFAVQNRGIKAHLVINTPSGKLGATTFSITDKAAQVCPTGAILIKNRVL